MKKNSNKQQNQKAVSLGTLQSTQIDRNQDVKPKK
jgi:hypothetical protein